MIKDGVTRLPIRLVPRKGMQFAILLGLAPALLLTTVFAVETLQIYTGGEFHPPTWQQLIRPGAILNLIAVGIALISVVATILRLWPGSPLHHLHLSAAGLAIREFGRPRVFPWDRLPELEVLQVEGRARKGSTKSRYYVVAMEGAAEPAIEEGRVVQRRELLRISAEEYGYRDAEADAAAMVSWFNRLRRDARERGLQADQEIAIPDQFLDSAISKP